MAALAGPPLTVHRGVMPDDVCALWGCVSFRGSAHGFDSALAAILHSALLICQLLSATRLFGTEALALHEFDHQADLVAL